MEIKTKEELEEELCEYCPCTDYGSVQINTAPWNMCEGCCCDDAYNEYLDYCGDEE